MSSSDPEFDEPIGRTVGNYCFEARIGAGGMGDVYRARDIRLGRSVAIKLLPGRMARDAERFERFQTEARAASSLNHPHILVVHDVGDVDGRPFIVTELVEGRTLRDVMEERPIGVREAIQVATQIAGALAAAHTRGIVHRDIKPENIMVRPDGYLKVVDFGLAKFSVASASGDDTRMLTNAGVLMGTPEYMSPEQASGQAVDFRSDQFSLAVLLYELLAGRRPFRRESLVQTAAAVITDVPEPLARVRPDLPPPLWWAIERCLEKRKEDRYQSTEELHRELVMIQGRLSDIRPAVTSLPAANLPVPSTSLVGRDAEAAAVRGLLERPDVRWVTLTGPGGVGKTRLAIHVAREMSRAFADATYFVPLAGVADGDQLVSLLLQLFEVRQGGGDDPLIPLTRHLRTSGASVLLVLDNFEHLASAAVRLAPLLEQCEQVKVLASSRARLHLSAEHEYQLSPLPLPEKAAGGARAAGAIPAVQLFVERARAARAGFTLTDENARAVSQICLALDGLPLAIELAAARVKMLPPDALLARLSGKSLSLDGGARDRPARQQTLRATIDWGYELLTAAEQRLFRRLGVFADGWTLESAEAVCDAREDLGVDTFDGISSLIDKSLVRPIVSTYPEPRFTMLSTLREYARERLDAAGEWHDVRKAHAAYCLVVAEEGSDQTSSPAPWSSLIDVEYSNIRAAIDYLVDTRQTQWALRLCTAVLPFWQERARLTEGRDALSRALALTDDDLSVVRARAMFALGAIVHPMGDPESCQKLESDALAIYRALGDRAGQAVSLNALGVSYHGARRYADARIALDEALEIWRALGRKDAFARTLANVAAVALDVGDLEEAIELYRETRKRCEEAGDATGAAWAINGEARAQHFRHDRQLAVTLYEHALQHFERLRDDWGAGDTLAALGVLAGEDGRDEIALHRLSGAQAAFARAGDARGTPRVVEAFAHLAAHRKQGERALVLAGAAAAMRHSLGAPLPESQHARLEATLDAVRRSLEPEQAAIAWMHGWSLTPDDAVRLAFDA
jgi:predicted ATPase